MTATSVIQSISPSLRVSTYMVIDQENIPQLDQSIKLPNQASRTYSELSPSKTNASKNKRSPGTPLTPSLQQPNITRRKLSNSVLHASTQRPHRNKKSLLAPTDTHALLELKFHNLLLEEQLKRSNEIIQFLELERQFERPEL